MDEAQVFQTRAAGSNAHGANAVRSARTPGEIDAGDEHEMHLSAGDVPCKIADDA